MIIGRNTEDVVSIKWLETTKGSPMSVTQSTLTDR